MKNPGERARVSQNTFDGTEHSANSVFGAPAQAPSQTEALAARRLAAAVDAAMVAAIHCPSVLTVEDMKGPEGPEWAELKWQIGLVYARACADPRYRGAAVRLAEGEWWFISPRYAAGLLCMPPPAGASAP